jgi:hypothetical protein
LSHLVSDQPIAEHLVVSNQPMTDQFTGLDQPMTDQMTGDQPMIDQQQPQHDTTRFHNQQVYNIFSCIYFIPKF